MTSIACVVIHNNIPCGHTGRWWLVLANHHLTLTKSNHACKFCGYHNLKIVGTSLHILYTCTTVMCNTMFTVRFSKALCSVFLV